MPQYLAPGVYVEEVPSAIKPIAGVGTSTAGFVGLVADNVVTPLLPGANPLREPTADEVGEDGRVSPGVDLAKTRGDHPDDFYPLAAAGVPKLVTSWEAFVKSFGDVQPGNRVLANAVYGFFNNGGTRCWVVRVNSAAGTAAAGVRVALTALGKHDDISLVVVPGATDAATQNEILDHCQNLGDRFAVLDGIEAPAELTPDEIVQSNRTSYGAVYFPWIDIGETGTDGQPVYQPPSGHVAGVYARVDGERGVHKAPANEVIRGALGLETLLNRADQAGLNPDGVNVLRRFDGNVTIWGARTLAGADEPEWRYVSVRRLFLYLRESIDQGTQWVVFEPNTPELWSRIRRNVGAFLTAAWTSGALFGTTPEQAFYVRCDETLNDEHARELGMVITEVGVAPVRPAEFVVFRIAQWAGPQG